MAAPHASTPVGTPARSRVAPAGYSFAAAGWLKAYHFGVAQALSHLHLHSHARFAGASAGSLMSVALALDLDIRSIKAFANECADEVRARPYKAFRLRQFVSAIIDRQLGEGAAAALGRRVEVAVTRLPFTRVRYKAFANNAELKSALLASCCMSPVAGMPFWMDGHLVFDGGLTDFRPALHGVSPADTVTVSPFYFSRADIRPSQYVPLWWAVFPPASAQLDKLYELGLRDTFGWAHGRGLIPSAAVPRRLTAAGSEDCGCSVVVEELDTPRSVVSATARSAGAGAGAGAGADPAGDAEAGAGGGAASGAPATGVAKAAPWWSAAHEPYHGPTLVCNGGDDCGGHAGVRDRPAPRHRTCTGCLDEHASAAASGRASAPVAVRSRANLALDLLTLTVLLSVRAMCLFAVYMELLVKAGLLLCKAVVCAVVGRRAASAALYRGARCLLAALSLRLLLRTVPVVGKKVPINVAKLKDLSFFFRLGLHVI